MAAIDNDQNLGIRALGAGDLIDRAVRFYRKFFATFILIASPPVIVGTLVSVGWTLVGRQIFQLGADRYSAENTFYYIFLWFGSVVIWLAETIATLVVMGGASRNFVRHLLFGEAITFRETYANVWKRLGGLVVASSLITVILGTLGIAIFYFGMTVGVLLILLIIYIFSFLPALAFIVSVIVGIAVAGGAIWLFFLAASRVAYVPQVMLVEGQGVFPAIGRSASLASGNVKRLAALFLFTTVAAYSALALLYVPLAWYASANGVQLMSFDADLVPAWYEIAYNLIWQISFILLSPVWMAGLCLLYVDERVRGEGYDIELMAARRLGEIPTVPTTYVNPLQPALSATAVNTEPAPVANRSNITTLGLK
ncbi:MAG TPA: hypothetical protein PLL77_06820 [Pyrinomonadaceae bacterium]|nr:hypothetical protein [Pyrinomonadaceae bacterium]